MEADMRLQQGMLSTEHFWALTILAIVVVIAIVFVIVFWILKGKRENAKIPVLCEEATVEHVDYQMTGNGLTSLRARNGMSLGTTHEMVKVTFRFANGDTIDMKLDTTQMKQIDGMKKGKLTYQGTRFVSFAE